MERFESVIDDVNEITINIVTNGYNTMAPGMCEHLDISAICIGEEEHFYRFTGPGVKKFYELQKEKDQKIRELENELGEWKREAANCLRLRDEVRREKNKEINELNQRLHQAEIDKRRLTYKLEEKSNLPETPITDAMLVNDYNRLIKENEELKKKLNTPSIPTKMLDRIAELDKLNKDLADSVLKSEGLNDLLRKRVKALEELKTPTIENFADEEPSSRRDILKAAEKCVCGQREQDYGTPESNFQLIADLWNGYLGFMDHPQDQIRATDVAMMMALMKIARIRNGGGSGDSFVDLAGYAACGGEIWYGRKKQVP